jgi:hypothetical protein
VASLEAQLAAQQQRGSQQKLPAQQEAARGAHSGDATAKTATEENNRQLAAQPAEAHRQLNAVQVLLHARVLPFIPDCISAALHEGLTQGLCLTDTLAPLQEALLKQQSLSQSLRAQLDSVTSHSHPPNAHASQTSPAAALPAPGSASAMDLISAMPADAAELTALRQRIAYLEAHNATLQHSAGAGRAAELPAPAAAGAAAAGAAIAALQQRNSYLEAQNATLQAAVAEAHAADAAAAHAAAPVLVSAADADTGAAGTTADRQAAAGADPAMTALLAASAAAAAAPLPPQHVRWEEQRRLQRQVDTLKHRLQVSWSPPWLIKVSRALERVIVAPCKALASKLPMHLERCATCAHTCLIVAQH